ncbi:hypothetical protein QQ045_015246 [Rhodiola kirilowii]
MDYFSKLYNSAVHNNTIKSYVVASGIPPVHHLLYADDLLLFSNGRKDSMRKVLYIVNKFCSISGHMLNQDKSKLFFSKSITPACRQKLFDLTKFSEGTFPTNYLGAPFFSGRPKIIYFKHLEDSIKNKVEG